MYSLMGFTITWL